MSKLPNGMIVFMRDQVIPGFKLFDIEVTNTFPLIALTETTHLSGPNLKSEILRGYDHIAIPPDFRLHISGPHDHLFFDANPIWDALEKGGQEPIHYFTVVGLPSARALPLVPPGQTKTWHQAMIISPFKDAEFNDSTRLFVDFFIHRMPVDLEKIKTAAFTMEGMRFANDQHGFIIGPHSFESLQRRPGVSIADAAFTMRIGFMNMEENDSMYVYTPLGIFAKRPR